MLSPERFAKLPQRHKIGVCLLVPSDSRHPWVGMYACMLRVCPCIRAVMLNCSINLITGIGHTNS